MLYGGYILNCCSEMQTGMNVPISAMLSYFCIFIGFMLLGVTAYLIHKSSPLPTESSYRLYRRKPLMTPNELEFWHRLNAAVPDYIIAPQVAMGAVIQVGLAQTHPRFYAIWNRFSRQIIDYCVLSKEGEVLLLIELDDSTHSIEKDAARDARTTQAGYRTLRIPSRKKPNVAELRALILETFSK